jgi:hypothetical protein
MIRNLSKFIFLILTLAFPALWGQTKSADLRKLSSVELQWEDSPGAFMYEVEVYNSKNKLLKKFVSKTSLFKFKSTSGKIKLRGRVMDAYGKKGLWSEMIETQVPPDDIKFPFDDASAIYAKASTKTLKGKVNLTWPEGTQAKKYLVKIYDKDNKVAQEKVVFTTHETFDLDVGDYHFTVTPIGNDQLAGNEIKSPRTIQIETAQLPSERFDVVKGAKGELQIKMPVKPGIKVFGELEYAHHLAEDWTLVLKYSPLEASIWTPDTKLKPGKYRVGFWVTRAGWTDSAKFKHEFVIKPTETDIIGQP